MSDVEKVLTNLSKRNMKGIAVQTKEEAVTKILQLIPQDASIGFGGSVTLEEIGILNELRNQKNRNLLDRTTVQSGEDRQSLYQKMFGCDVFLSGTNAITEKGQLVNVDGIGNRIAMITYGPKKVIIVVGKNKIVTDLDAAMHRLKTVAMPINLKRVREAAKQSTLFSSMEWTKETIWGQISIIERQVDPDRITVIIVDKDLGF